MAISLQEDEYINSEIKVGDANPVSLLGPPNLNNVRSVLIQSFSINVQKIILS